MERDTLIREIGKRIRLCREEKGLTQKELAQKLSNCSNASISDYEKGRAPVPLNLLYEICQALNVSSDYLLSLTDYAPSVTQKPNDANLRVRFGLTDEAMEQLAGIPYGQSSIDAINYLLEYGVSSGLFDEIEKYMNQPDNQKQDEQALIIQRILFKLLDKYREKRSN